jgi:hypothetical protein
MRERRPSVVYKLPVSFVRAQQSDLDAIDWDVSQSVTLALGWPQDPVLEVVSGRSGARVVRPGTPKSANLIRRYSDTLSSEE